MDSAWADIFNFTRTKCSKYSESSSIIKSDSLSEPLGVLAFEADGPLNKQLSCCWLCCKEQGKSKLFVDEFFDVDGKTVSIDFEVDEVAAPMEVRYLLFLCQSLFFWPKRYGWNRKLSAEFLLEVPTFLFGSTSTELSSFLAVVWIPNCSCWFFVDEVCRERCWKRHNVFSTSEEPPFVNSAKVGLSREPKSVDFLISLE